VLETERPVWDMNGWVWRQVQVEKREERNKVEVKLPQKVLGRLLVKGYSVFGRGVPILTVREDMGTNRLPAAFAGFLHAEFVIRHFGLYVRVFGRVLVMESVGKQEGPG
jgi:hypothetical protein